MNMDFRRLLAYSFSTTDYRFGNKCKHPETITAYILPNPIPKLYIVGCFDLQEQNFTRRKLGFAPSQSPKKITSRMNLNSSNLYFGVITQTSKKN